MKNKDIPHVEQIRHLQRVHREQLNVLTCYDPPNPVELRRMKLIRRQVIAKRKLGIIAGRQCSFRNRVIETHQ